MSSYALQVLLVEPAWHVREMLRTELAPLAIVSATGDAGDILNRSGAESPPDLLICDYRSACGAGFDLADTVRRANPNAAIVMLASRNDRQRAASWEAVDDIIEKPFFLADAVGRIRRVLERLSTVQPKSSDGLVRGTLAHMSVIDLLQSMEMGRKTCLLTLESEDNTCGIYFADGLLEDAFLGRLRGEPAVYEVLGWTNGTFTIDFSQVPGCRSTTRSTQGILLEGLRLLDERKRNIG